MPNVGDIVRTPSGEIGRICCVNDFGQAAVKTANSCDLLPLESLTLANGSPPDCTPDCFQLCQ